MKRPAAALVTAVAILTLATSAHAATSADTRQDDPTRTLILHRHGGLMGFNNKVAITNEGFVFIWAPVDHPAEPHTCRVTHILYDQLKALIKKSGIKGNQLPGGDADHLIYSAQDDTKILDLEKTKNPATDYAKKFLDLNGASGTAAGLCTS